MTLKDFVVSGNIPAYDVLERIKRLFLEEPKRVSMQYELRLRVDDRYQNNPTSFPRCGAVGCIIGWTGILAGVAEAADGLLAFRGADAEDYLGITSDQGQELFYPDWWSSRTAHGGPQTRKYAAAVAKHISDFQAKYETQLKRHICDSEAIGRDEEA